MQRGDLDLASIRARLALQDHARIEGLHHLGLKERRVAAHEAWQKHETATNRTAIKGTSDGFMPVDYEDVLCLSKICPHSQRIKAHSR